MEIKTGGGYAGRPVDLSRKVLYLDLNPADPVQFPGQVSAQWDIHRVSDPELAQEILESTPCPVGLVQLDNLTAKLYDQVQQLVNDTPHTNWIALLHKPSLDHPTIRKLIHDFFLRLPYPATAGSGEPVPAGINAWPRLWYRVARYAADQEGASGTGMPDGGRQ